MKPRRQERNLLLYIDIVSASPVLEITNFVPFSQTGEKIQIPIVKSNSERWVLEFFGVQCSYSFVISSFQVNFLALRLWILTRFQPNTHYMHDY